METKPELTPQAGHGGTVDHRYSSVREQCSSPKPVEQLQKEISASDKLDPANSEEPPSVSMAPDSPAETASTWALMKMGLQNFRESMGSKKFLRLSLSPRVGTNESATESLDEIFRKLKRHSSNADADHLDDDGLP